EFGRPFDHVFRCIALAIREPDDDVAPRVPGRVQPQVPRPCDPEGEFVVLLRAPPDQDLESVDLHGAPTSSLAHRSTSSGAAPGQGFRIRSRALVSDTV